MAFDIRAFAAMRFGGHGNRLGIAFHDASDDWVEMALPYRTDMIGDPASGVIASGPIVALMDIATSMAVWMRAGRFVAHATLDLRVDYLRGAKPGHTVIGRGECYRITRSVAFIRGQAHDGDPDDPIAHVAGTFMAPEGYP
ncbi:Phenylacetic acid degradation protein [Sphingomonas sp. EC-HK361]|uniref:PaaI family thioesterase n=1 Tax=Sphingomonas sp. EC-HK361 TaxID=2038397 RepID=UPI0012524B8A|nr:PaaI family thioesterase [Sphingomonas sp. EC-HK361]VVS98659.1 Phenylacetic acid degradation protein [Sphingomonas sp. EC-HK361]